MFDHRTRRVILGIALTVAAIGIVLILYRMWRVADMTNMNPDRIVAEGEAFGRGKTDVACVEQALDRADQCLLWDIRCETEAGFFASACMLHARKTPQICGQFKSSGNIGIDLFYGSGGGPELCAKRGLEGDTGCNAVMTRVAQTCTAGAAIGNIRGI